MANWDDHDVEALAADYDAVRAALEAIVKITDGQPGALIQKCRQIALNALNAEGKE